MIKKDDYKQFIGLILSGIISYIVVNLANAYLLSVLGQVSYGDFSLTISLIFSLTPIYTAGITMLMTKYVPIYF